MLPVAKKRLFKWISSRNTVSQAVGNSCDGVYILVGKADNPRRARNHCVRNSFLMKPVFVRDPQIKKNLSPSLEPRPRPRRFVIIHPENYHQLD